MNDGMLAQLLALLRISRASKKSYVQIRSRGRRTVRQLMLEGLEDRKLLAAITLTGNYTQNFDSLPNSGTSIASSLLPAGWEMAESGSTADNNLGVDDGNNTVGNTYNYGSSGFTDRALGMLRDANNTSLIGVAFKNGGSTPIHSLLVGYTGEQWRLGQSGHVDQLKFEYSTNATSLTTGAWTSVSSLDFTAPLTLGVGAKNGNQLGQVVINPVTIASLNIPSDAIFYIRWRDFDAVGNDDGLAIDDFAITPSFSTVPVVNSPANSAINYGSNTTFTASATGVPTPTVQWQTLVGSTWTNITAGTDGGIYSGFVSNTLTLTKPPVSLSGRSYRAVYTNIAASVNSNAAVLSVTALPLTVSGLSGVSRPYDGSTVATLTGTGVLSGVLAADLSNISLDTSAGVYTFSSKDIGQRAITVTGLGLSGAAGPNYVLAQPTGLSATITAAPLTVTGLTGVSRVYDSSVAASVAGIPALSGVVAGESAFVTLDASAASYVFASKNVGVRSIAATGFVISGVGAANYALSQPTGLSAEITAAQLNVSGLTGVNRVYDATVIASVSGTPVLNGVVPADAGNVVLDVSGASYQFASKNVGVRTITVAGLSITGTESSNYLLVPPTGLSATIAAAPLSVVGLSGVDRDYDGTTNASVSGTPSLAGVVPADIANVALNMSGASYLFDSKNIGSRSIIASGLSIAGSESSNYLLTQPTGLSAIISPFALTSTATANDRAYDSTISVPVQIQLVGVFVGDSVSASASGAFANKNVGNGKSVSISNLILNGPDASNYTVTSPASPVANVTPYSITGSIAVPDKFYDGTASAVISTRVLSSVFSGDDLSYVGGTASFADASIGNNKVVTAVGLSLAGTDSGNYQVNSIATTTASILAPIPSVSGPIIINGGQVQRSQLTSVTVNFTTPVALDPGAITIGNVGLLASTPLTNLAASQLVIAPASGFASTFTITFDTLTAVSTGTVSGGVVKRVNGQNSLADGNYQLNVIATKVKNQNNVSMAGNFSFGTSLADSFFRMFGDSNGDGIISGGDLTVFRLAMVTYNPAMDWDGNGVVNGTGIDFTSFSTGYAKRRRSL